MSDITELIKLVVVFRACCSWHCYNRCFQPCFYNKGRILTSWNYILSNLSSSKFWVAIFYFQERKMEQNARRNHTSHTNIHFLLFFTICPPKVRSCEKTAAYPLQNTPPPPKLPRAAAASVTRLHCGRHLILAYRRVALATPFLCVRHPTGDSETIIH